MKWYFLGALLCWAFCGDIEGKKQQEKGSSFMLAPKGTTLIGALVATHHRNLPTFNIFFNGKAVPTNSDGVFRCKTDRDIQDELFIFVGHYSDPKPSRHETIRRIGINKKSKHRFFRLAPDPNDPRKWQVEEMKNMENDNYELPKQTLIYAFSPEIMDSFEVTVYQANDKQIVLPRLKLKDIDNKMLQRASAKSLLYPIGTMRHHAPVTQKHRQVSGNGRRMREVEIVVPLFDVGD